MAERTPSQPTSPQPQQPASNAPTGSTVTIPPLTGPHPAAPGAAPAPGAPAAPPTPAVAAPQFVNGRITRDGMETAIRAGGSVLHNGRVLTRVEDLPSRDQVANDHLEAHRVNIAQRRDMLRTDEAAAKARGATPGELQVFAQRHRLLDAEQKTVDESQQVVQTTSLEDIARRRADLDAQEAALKAKR
jgi:hypothetical protein